MIAVLIAYIKIRMHFVQLIGLTILMSMLVLSPKDPFEIWLFSMLLLVISFMVFRFLDDAFSVTIDRKEHPERTYLISANFKSFKKITAIIIAVYLISVGLVFSKIFFTLFLLLISSLALYFMFWKQLVVLKLIPLVKYPVLLYCASMISSHEVQLEIGIASFLLMAGFDSFDRVKVKSNTIWQPMLFLFCASILLFKPWLNSIDILFSLVPLLFIYSIRNKRIVPYFSIVFFSITFFIRTHL
jgi:hypothetical protein